MGRSHAGFELREECLGIQRDGRAGVTDALEVARTHVFTIEVAEGCVITSAQAPHDSLHVQSRIVIPQSKKRYLQNHHHAAKVQLTKAAVRLADLLNRMSWK